MAAPDRLSPIEAELHIRSELQRLGVQFKEDANSFRVVCPNPHPGGGPNTHKNYNIHKNGRTSYCFVCKATGSWDFIAHKFGANKFNNTGLLDDKALDFDFTAALRSRMAALAFESSEDTATSVDTLDLQPWLGDWRGMSESFLQAVGAKRWVQVIDTGKGMPMCVDRIWFPCMQHQSMVGYVSRRLDKSTVARYYNDPNMKSTDVLFPFDFAVTRKTPYVVLVEGPVDALNLLYNGVTAVSMLGAGNFGSKDALLYAAGYKKVYVLMDGDEAGRTAAPSIAGRLNKSGMAHEVMSLPDGLDPGDMTKGQVAWLKAYAERNT